MTSSFLFIKSYPKVKAGSQIIVPEKPEVKKTSVSEIVGFAGIVASIAGVVIAVLRR